MNFSEACDEVIRNLSPHEPVNGEYQDKSAEEIYNELNISEE